MKRWGFVFALLLMIATPVPAQVQGGTVTGTAMDDQGGVLPGVAVTLQGVDATQIFTTGLDGKFRFLNLAPGPYTLTAALQGFTTLVRENVIVLVGKNVDLPMTMKIAAVAETVTVSGQSPVVDTKATGTATNFTSDELTKIPTSRDPFALMRSVPGVLVDRVNIGGNETGQQSNFAFTFQPVNVRVIGDLFNAFNRNTALVRNNNVLSPSFNTLAQNLSPRIFRIGLVVGF